MVRRQNSASRSCGEQLEAMKAEKERVPEVEPKRKRSRRVP